MLVDEGDGHFCWLSSLSLREIYGRQQNDLVRLLEFAALSLQALELFPLSRCMSVAYSSISLGLANPTLKHLRRAIDLFGHGADRHPVRLVLVILLDDQPNRPFPDFRGELHCFSRNCIL
jgi:hypothetical protein